jgi:membrane-associated protease RseP (regulator of RpoE activity)
MVERQASGAVVGVFRDRADAERAVEELHRAGYDESQIGFAAPDDQDNPPGTTDHGVDSKTGEKAGAGVVGGGVLGGILGAAATGLIPGIGPVIAVGALTGILGGAAAGGIAGALAGMGVADEDAEIYQEEFKAGRTIVTVQPDGEARPDEREILERHGAYDASSRPRP